MTTKKPTALLALVGACALAVTGPASLASPPTPTAPQPTQDAQASSLPVGDIDTALTSKNGETATPEADATVNDQDPARVVGIIVQLQDGADRSSALASINEAVAGAVPGSAATVEREYDNALDGYALKAPAGSLSAIRAANGVKAAFIERETPVADVVGDDAEGGVASPRGVAQNPDNLSAQLIMHADQLTQKGEGKVVAVIDTGVEMTHPAFSGTMTGTPALTADDVAALIPKLGEGKAGIYYNEKFPFAYDYADSDNDAMPSPGDYGSHGTHVAGITAGDADQIVGVAPDAQIIVAKVSRSVEGDITDSALLAALDDMVVLKPDVVNLSLGQLGGMDNEVDSIYATVFKSLQDAGVTVNAAAGNHYTAGYGNTSGKNLPFASDPDSSTQCEPATYSSVVSVASLDNLLSYNAFTAAGKDIAYQRARGFNGEKAAELSEMAPGDYEYVDGGFASEEDAAALKAKYPDGLAGKFVLVSRGQMTFQKKIENLAPLKPAGILVYNNVAGDSLMIMSVTTLDVPAAFISNESGKAMLEAADHHLTLVDGKTVTPSAKYSMSDFSSWGVTPDLRLKPEVTAPGGNIYSAILNGKYDLLSGTSMATPQMAGVSAVVLERVQSDPLFASMSAREKVDVVQNLIMGTATPVTDAAQDSGALYSPRKQGAGLVDVLAATTSSVYPTVEGAPEQSRPKADLGDGTKGWHFDVVLHNLSDAEATYELGSQALSENVADGFFTGSATDWRGKGVTVAYSGVASAADEGATVTIPAKGEATIGIDITPGTEFAAHVADNTPAGTFLDGFVRFTSKTDAQPSLTVPYVGFYGDWGKPAIFDALASDGGAHTFASGLYNGTTGTLLGYNPLVKADARTGNPRADRYVISRATASGAPTVLDPRTGTLRSVHTLKTTYASTGGNVIADFTTHQAWKSGVNPGTGKMTWVEDGHESTALDLRSDAFKNLPDGDYTLVIHAHNDGPSQAEQSIAYNFSVDTTAPTVDTLAFSKDGDAPHVTIAVTDNKPLAGIDLHDPADGLWFYRHIFSDTEGVKGDDGKYRYELNVPMSELSQAWTDQGGSGEVIAHPYLLAWDYGLNHSEPRTVDLPTSNEGAKLPCTDPAGGHWANDAVGWWYVCANGSDYLASGWYTINGSDYQFGPAGYMMTGFLKRPSGEWVYADASGTLLSGWIRDGGSWYYLDPATNVMATGWLSQGGSWYYLGDSGDMHTGWVKVDGLWYYLSSSGAMHTGWLQQGGSWYYLGPDGAMFTGTHTINGRTYTFDESGVWQR